MSAVATFAKTAPRVVIDSSALRRFTVTEYHEMINTGILVVVHTKPRGGKHQKVVEFAEKQSVPLILDGTKIADIPVSELIAKS